MPRGPHWRTHVAGAQSANVGDGRRGADTVVRKSVPHPGGVWISLRFEVVGLQRGCAVAISIGLAGVGGQLDLQPRGPYRELMRTVSLGQLHASMSNRMP